MGKSSGPEQATLAERRPEASGPPPLYAVRVVRGPDAGKAIVLDWNNTPEVLVGQSSVCELALTDPRVSRRHLSLAQRGHAIAVVDLRSTNGTRVGGARIVEAILEGGETVEIGESALSIVRAGSLPELVSPRDRFGRVLGRSHDMLRLFARCEKLSVSPLPIVLEGETGTGKELLAEAIHESGPRANGPLVVFDCGAHEGDEQITALFGRGAPGAFGEAAGGTLVLVDVGDLAPAAQGKLAAVVERAPARLIATTRRDLDREVEQGRFREELLFRLAGARVRVPPLRERHGDIELLARHFWHALGGAGDVPKSFLLRLAHHEWPGNVRELQHAVARRVSMGEDLEPGIRGASAGGPADFLERVLAMDLPMQRARQAVIHEFERRYVERAVAAHGGNVSRAAAASGLTRRYFHMLLAKNKP